MGQPVATPEMLHEALAGRSAVDGGWWAELADLATEVLVDPDGIVQGVLATAVRPRYGAGLLLWCHGREDPAAVSTLVGRAIERLADRPRLHAFDFASALSFGLEALPVRHRDTTDRALHEAGLTSRDLWRYAHRRGCSDRPGAGDRVAVMNQHRASARGHGLARPLLGRALEVL